MDMENEIWSIMNQNLDLEPMKKRREDWIQLDNKICACQLCVLFHRIPKSLL